MNARRRILERVKAVRFAAPRVERWDFPPAEMDLTTQFSKALTAAKGEVLIAKDLSAALQSLAKLLTEMQAKSVVFNPDTILERGRLEAELPEFEWRQAAGSSRQVLNTCQQADAGLTTALFGLAETGSVGIASSGGNSRLVSLVPETHIALLESAKLIPDLLRWEQVRPKRMPSQLVLVSGPSKTADIEQTLVVGAHGPKRLVVIVYGS